MSLNTKRTLVILLVVAISIAVGFAVDGIWQLFEKKSYPQSYDDIIADASDEFDVPVEIIYATIKVESDFDPEAISGKGARGLMQMIPDTFEWLTGDEHLKEYRSISELSDPEVSIRYGTYYLSYLYKKFDYNWDTTFAAYNAGEGNVSKWLKDPSLSDGEGNLTSIPIKETERYINKIHRALSYYETHITIETRYQTS